MSRKQGEPMSHRVVSHAAHHASSDVRTYLMVFGALAALTLMTVGVSSMHLPHAAGLVVALLIAAAKVFLIGSFFMHLRSEGRLINWSIAACVLLVLVLIVFVLPDLGVHELEETAPGLAAPGGHGAAH